MASNIAKPSGSPMKSSSWRERSLRRRPRGAGCSAAPAASSVNADAEDRQPSQKDGGGFGDRLGHDRALHGEIAAGADHEARRLTLGHGPHVEVANRRTVVSLAERLPGPKPKSTWKLKPALTATLVGTISEPPSLNSRAVVDPSTHRGVG